MQSGLVSGHIYIFPHTHPILSSPPKLILADALPCQGRKVPSRSIKVADDKARNLSARLAYRSGPV